MSSPAGTSSPPTGAAGALRPDSPFFTLALYAVVLAVVFTVAFWVGRTLGPTPVEPVPAPSQHAPTTHAWARPYAGSAGSDCAR